MIGGIKFMKSTKEKGFKTRKYVVFAKSWFVRQLFVWIWRRIDKVSFYKRIRDKEPLFEIEN